MNANEYERCFLITLVIFVASWVVMSVMILNDVPPGWVYIFPEAGLLVSFIREMTDPVNRFRQF